MDLFVWYGEGGRIRAFQLAYDKQRAERTISWRDSGGYRHERVDEGARPGRHPASPLLVADGAFQAERVRDVFRQRAAGIEPGIAELVLERLAAYPGAAAGTAKSAAAHGSAACGRPQAAHGWARSGARAPGRGCRLVLEPAGRRELESARLEPENSTCNA